ncbi:MAG: sigma-54-dependent Fis family transcriptional regulator [Deltaproteobacteria bacterium]|nr:MAG: sigma-54-dependent Fis family transcriptional regulator [Deltaproteobacteria bacterium]
MHSNNSNILLVEDEYEERIAMCDALGERGYNVRGVSDGLAALKELKVGNYDVVITDLKMQGLDGLELLKKIRGQRKNLPVIVVSGHGTVESAVEAMKLGAFDFIPKPFPLKIIESVVAKATGQSLSYSAEKPFRSSESPIVTKNPRMLRLLDMAKSIADSKAPVFIQGESGTGKELFARFIHKVSARQCKPFVAVNCAALPDGLLESELFGHEKGAFTGAVSRKLGKFELARNGTILLDEISEMDIRLQAKLLRVLQESEVDRVGGHRPVRIDSRVIATTNRDIEQMVKAGKFRADLYYRLNVIPIKLIPLRERKDDIPLLADYFIKKYNRIDGRRVRGMTKNAARTLVSMHWPGNVRELENIVERAVLLCNGDLIDEHDLFPGEKPATISEPLAPLTGSLKEMERKMIFQTLNQTNGNRTHAAEILGISVRTLRNKLNEYRQRMETL